jgi:hypothetical protein
VEAGFPKSGSSHLHAKALILRTEESHSGQSDRISGVRSSRAWVPALVTAYALLFLVGKHISSAGSVTLDQFQYWIAGILPVAIASLAIQQAPGPLMSLGKLTLYTWATSLGLFVILRMTHLAAGIEQPLYALVRSRGYGFYLWASVLYCLLGYLAVSLASLAARTFSNSYVRLALPTVGLTAALFFVLVFLI